MNVVTRAVNDISIGVAIANAPEALTAFLDPGCSAALWRRETPPDVQTWLDALDLDCLPKGRVILPPSAVSDTVAHLCDLSGMPSGPERDWLEADISALATQLSDLLSPPYLRMRLDVVTNNACRKFHIDAITARLVCTYRGTGTQYGISVGGHDPEDVHTVATGSPILLRGTLWPAQPATGLLHRSPPIEGTGETRLVLVLDPVDAMEDDR